MKTPKEFDYDLWKDNDGKYFIRVKRTGEICEVNKDTFRVLHTEAVRMYRSQKGTPVYGKKNGKNVLVEYTTTLSLNFLDNNMENAWCSDDGQSEERIVTAITIDAFCKHLTEKQLAVFKNCLINETSLSDYAIETNTTPANIFYHIQCIRKKAKIFFD